jgi:beta-glucanase (GH16 family)
MRNVDRLRVMRRSLACALVVAGLAYATGASAWARSSRHHGSAVVVHKRVSAPGLYVVSIVIRSPTAALNRIEVRVGTLARRAVSARLHRHARLSMRVHIAGRSLTVSAVGRRARPILAIALRRLVARRVVKPKPAASVTPKPAATAKPLAPAPAPVPVSVPAATTHPPPAPPPSPLPAAPGPGSPFTKLVWSDVFTQDWTSAGGSGAATRPVSSAWGFDTWGGCGGNSPQQSTYPGTPNTAYLTSQGLALPAIAAGPNHYVAAQLDTAGRNGESWQYGTIEASIQLPSGAGLCPAFWMLADNGTGEIDILEAPAFVNSVFGPLGPHAIFTLHANRAQQFESVANPTWNPGLPNVYGVIWTPKSITWTVNYVPYATATAASLGNPGLWSAFTSGRFHLLLDEAVGGWPGDPPTGTVFSQSMVVQWVKVFQ